MTLGKGYVSAPVVEWIYEKPQHGGAKTLLLTIGCIAITGTWSGEVGENYLAWAALPKRDKTKEREILTVLREKRLAAERAQTAADNVETVRAYDRLPSDSELLDEQENPERGLVQ